MGGHAATVHGRAKEDAVNCASSPSVWPMYALQGLILIFLFL